MRGKGKFVAAGGGLAVIVALVALFGELGGFGGGGGDSAGTGTGTGAGSGTNAREGTGDVRMAVLPGAMTANPTTRPTTLPSGPLQITVEGNDYLVEGKKLDLSAVRELLKSKAASDETAIVEVVRRPNARAKAEEDLRTELEKHRLRVAATPPW